MNTFWLRLRDLIRKKNHVINRLLIDREDMMADIEEFLWEKYKIDVDLADELDRNPLDPYTDKEMHMMNVNDYEELVSPQ